MSEHPTVTKSDSSTEFYFKNLTNDRCIVVFIKSSDIEEGNEINCAKISVDPWSFENNEDCPLTKNIILRSNRGLLLKNADILNYYVVIYRKKNEIYYSLGRDPRGRYFFH